MVLRHSPNHNQRFVLDDDDGGMNLADDERSTLAGVDPLAAEPLSTAEMRLLEKPNDAYDQTLDVWRRPKAKS